MSDRNGIDPRKPWQLFFKRGEQHVPAASYDSAADVIAALVTAPDPTRVYVHHLPTDRNGNGADFLRHVNNRLAEEA